jgi:hypothetical protein
MTRTLIPQGAFALAITVASGACAGPLSDADINTLIKAEAPKAAIRWNLRPLFEIDDGKSLEMSPNGVIRFGRSGVQAALTHFDDKRRELALRWIVGHETWHQAQRRDAEIPRPEDLPARRQLECEADVMATQYLIESEPVLNREKPDLSHAKEIGATINRISDMVQQAEQGFGGEAGHPSGNHRRSAIRLGLIRGMLGQAANIPDREARYALTAQIRSLIDYRDDEHPNDWNTRICQMIMNSGDGSASLSELKPSIVFNKDGAPPIVDFAIPYKNVGIAPINVSMQVTTVAVPRSSPENADSWKWVDGANFHFELAPGQQYTVSGRLLWVATSDAYPRLLSPKDIGSLYTAEQFDRAPNEQRESQSFALTPRQSRLANMLQMIFNSGAGKFQNVSKEPCRVEDGNKICGLKVDVPAARSAEVIYEGGGGASVEIELYRGNNLDEAKNVFAGFKNDLELIFATTIGEKTTLAGTRVATFKPTSTLKLELRQHSLQNRNWVTATVTPALY